MEVSNAFRKEHTRQAYGIDLGTTNSCISVVNNSGVAEVIKLDNGKSTMPSCVLWDSNAKAGSEFVVGDEAYNQRFKKNAIYSVKRLMGSGEVIKLTHGKKSRTMTPAEVSSIILKGLVEKASTMHKDIKDVVITVPAEFTTQQVEDTKLAAELAGLNLLNIMREPTAASLAYKLDKESRNILVYDLGGGTFDVSLVNIQTTGENSGSDVLDLMGIDLDDTAEKSVITVKATRGNNKLGGDDLDRYVLDILLERLKEQGISEASIKDEDLEKLLLDIERYKKFDNFENVRIKIDWVLKTKRKLDTEVVLLPKDYKKATFKIFNQTKKYIDDLLKSQNVKIDDIVLVGGSTKNTYLRQLLQECYSDCNISLYLNPDEAVSLGAALNAKRLKFGADDIEVFDVTSNALGVLADGRVSAVIDKNQSIPCVQSITLATTSDNQEVVEVAIYEGSSIYPQEDIYLGSLVIDGIPKKPKGRVGVHILLSIDSNGLLTCEALVEGKREKKELINVLGRTVKKADKSSSVAFDRWYKFANSIDDPDRSSLIKLIDSARVEPTKKADVIKRIQEIRDEQKGK